MPAWTVVDIPDQSGRTVVVTGSNSGIGLVAARELALAGAHVVLAVRDVDKGARAAAEIDAAVGEQARSRPSDDSPARSANGSTEVRALDLADLASVRAFADGVDGHVDVLVNNAGVMAVPHRRTADGFEMQIGTNFLGPFALTGLLLDRVTDRVVTLSSVAHRLGALGALDVTDLNWQRRRYQRWLAYGQSKLADLMFAYELEHRFVAAGSPLRSMAAHPGYSATNLQSRTESFQDLLMSLTNTLVAQPAEMGALPTLCAATMSDLPGGAYIGPDGWSEASGHPVPVGSSAASHDRVTQRRLWDKAAELTGVSPVVPASARH